MIIVRLFKVGAKKVDSYPIEKENPTVQEFFEDIGEEYVQGTVTMKNMTVERNTVLRDNDTLYIVGAMRGNISNLPFEVKFIRLGDRRNPIMTVTAEDGFTIKRTLDQFEVDDRSKFYGADGKPAYQFQLKIGEDMVDVDEDHILIRPEGEESLRVVCAQRIKGNKEKKV